MQNRVFQAVVRGGENPRKSDFNGLEPFAKLKTAFCEY